jgi:hypothetical protein
MRRHVVSPVMQLGDATNTNRIAPSSTVLTGVTALAAGYAHSCALMSTGGVRCWGMNVDGQASSFVVVRRVELQAWTSVYCTPTSCFAMLR